MARRARLNVAGGVFHVVSRFARDEWRLDADGAREAYLDYVGDASETGRVEVLSYCLMSNHVHLVVVQGERPLERFTKSLHTGFSAWSRRRVGDGSAILRFVFSTCQGSVLSVPLQHRLLRGSGCLRRLPEAATNKSQNRRTVPDESFGRTVPDESFAAVALASYASAGYSMVGNIMAQNIQYELDPSTSNGAPMCGGAFEANWKAVVVSGVMGAIGLPLAGAVGINASQAADAVEIAAQAAWGWVTSSVEFGANALWSE